MSKVGLGVGTPRFQTRARYTKNPCVRKMWASDCEHTFRARTRNLAIHVGTYMQYLHVYIFY